MCIARYTFCISRVKVLLLRTQLPRVVNNRRRSEGEPLFIQWTPACPFRFHARCTYLYLYLDCVSARCYYESARTDPRGAYIHRVVSRVKLRSPCQPRHFPRAKVSRENARVLLPAMTFRICRSLDSTSAGSEQCFFLPVRFVHVAIGDILADDDETARRVPRHFIGSADRESALLRGLRVEPPLASRMP